MSDNEQFGSGGGGGADEELTLPRATVQKLISEALPGDLSASREVKELIVEACTEFIHLVSSEANEMCEKSGKKTIGPDHCMEALKELGFESYVSQIGEVLEDHKVEMKQREKKASKMAGSGLSAEELQAQQEALFAASRARYEAGN